MMMLHRSLSAVRRIGRHFTTEPFYGHPRPPPSSLHLLFKQAATAWTDPTRADAVATVGELTGTRALERLASAMKVHPIGRKILEERPIVSKETVDYERWIQQAAKNKTNAKDLLTLGDAYGAYLAAHDFDPDERDQVRFIEDETLAYVMLRYRQCHDFWHAITGLPPTVPGELGLKWLELFQTGLPLAALSPTMASIGLSAEELHQVWRVYLPWAVVQSKSMQFGAIMMVEYEKELVTPLVDLQARLCLQPAPKLYQ